MGKKMRVTCVAEHDFTSNRCLDMFETKLSLNDGCVYQNCEGLLIDSHKFTKTPEAGDNNEYRANGWLDNFKNVLLTCRCFDVPHCKEIVLDANATAAQFFCVDKPVPEAFLPRVRNIRADPRLANGQLFFIDPFNGVIAGFLITNHVTYAMYGRLPYARTREGCAWAIDCVQKECVPCKTCPDNAYNCENFSQDKRFIAFKQSASQREWMQFMHYIRWRESCGNNPYDWVEYGNFCRKAGPLSCDYFTRERWVRWVSYYDWAEYQFYLEWCVWREHEAQFGRVASCDFKCAGQSCQQRVFYSLPASLSKCSGDGCAGCNTCTAAAEVTAEHTYKRECYAYQWGTVRCCCDFQGAAFLSLVEVARNESCDPLKDFRCLAVGIDRSHSALRWTINNVEVFKHVGIGRRTAEQYRVRDNGGYAEDVDVARIKVGFGTGSLLDAGLPNNYSRTRAVNDEIDSTALVPLLCESAYFNPYFSKLGELLPATQNPTLAFATSGRVGSASGLSATDPQWRLFGQGAIFRIRYLNVYTRSLLVNPVYAPASCDDCCYGPRPAGDCHRYRGCGKNSCEGGCCGRNCDVPDSDSDSDSDLLQSLIDFQGQDRQSASSQYLPEYLQRQRRFKLDKRQTSKKNCSDDESDIPSVNLYN